MREKSFLRILVFMLLTACPSAYAAVIADFNGSAVGGTPASISAPNLDAGTVGGSWTVNQIGLEADDGGPGASKIEVYADASGDNQLQLDGPRLADRSISFDYRLNLNSPLALGTTLVFDVVARRAGNAAIASSERNGLIRGLDATGDILFELVIDGVGTPTRGTIGLVGQPASSEVINFLAANSQAITTDMTTIAIVLGASTFDVIVGDVVAYSGIGYTDTVTDLSELQFTGSGPDAGFSGYSIDNIETLLVASSPVPANGTTDVDPAGLNSNGLGWDLPTDAGITGSFFYLSKPGDEPNFVGVIPDFIAGNGAGITHNPSFTFALDQNIFWRVDTQINNSAAGDPNNITGFVWNFETTKSVPVVTADPVRVGHFPGETATFTCDFTSISVPTVDWLKSGGSVGTGLLVNNGGNSYTATFTIGSVADTDAGDYACQITGGGVTTSADATLLIKDKQAHWKFDGDFLDTLGNFDLMAIDPNNGPPTFTTGRVGQALDCNGLDDGSVLPGVVSMEPLGLDWFAGWTVNLWTRTPDDNPDAFSGVFHTQSESSSSFQIDTNGSGSFRYNEGSEVLFGPITADEWVMLTVAWDGETTRLYFNGVEVATDDDDHPLIDRFGFCVNRGLNDFYEGSVDDAMVWNYALDKFAIFSLYNAVTGETTCFDELYAAQFDTNDDCVVNVLDFSEFADGYLSDGTFPAP